MLQIGEGDFDHDEKQRSVVFTESGTEKLENLFRDAGLMKSESLYDLDNVNLVHHANSALRAHKMFSKDKDYIVRNDEVVIIDEFTGRMPCPPTGLWMCAASPRRNARPLRNSSATRWCTR